MILRKNDGNLAGFDDLARELDAWSGHRATAAFWWRDDDACNGAGQLKRLLHISEETGTPAAIAAIPFKASDDLAGLLAGYPLVCVLQHGCWHVNHALAFARKSEFPANRSRDEMLQELAEGRRRMERFANALPVLAAPWNRLDPGLLPLLPGIGITGLSGHGPRGQETPAPGLKLVNVHADPVDWRCGRRFTGARAFLRQVTGHLSARRAGLADAKEPTGLLTHHHEHDEEFFEFFGDFLRRVHAHPAVRWMSAVEIFKQ